MRRSKGKGFVDVSIFCLFLKIPHICGRNGKRSESSAYVMSEYVLIFAKIKPSIREEEKRMDAKEYRRHLPNDAMGDYSALECTKRAQTKKQNEAVKTSKRKED